MTTISVSIMKSSAAMMVNIKRWAITLGVALATPKTWAEAAATAATAAVSATAVGIDPWPWVIGGFGAAVVYVKRPATTKWDAIINSLISICIGGIIAPWVAALAGEYVSPKFENNYAFALILSSVWPWAVPAMFDKFRDTKIDLPFFKSSEGE